jgi:lysophospholipid acyltransferase (LPLAT)-like uncharacterized protein
VFSPRRGGIRGAGMPAGIGGSICLVVDEGDCLVSGAGVRPCAVEFDPELIGRRRSGRPMRDMSLGKRFLRHPPVQRVLGRLAAAYLRLVRLTNRFEIHAGGAHPGAADGWIDARTPLILGMWHGQHIMMPLLRRPGDRVATIISRSPDGDINTIALERFGVRVLRASGARGRTRATDQRAKGGAEGLRAMLRALKAGESVAFSADVPKISRRCDAGILTLARFSGRPIVPAAVVTSRHLRFGSWDRACLGLPFGRGAIVLGDPIYVPRDSDGDGFETLRRFVEAEMNRVHARAYALVGRADRAALYRDPPVETGGAPVGDVA